MGAQVRHFGLCEGRQAKNDPADAKLIARFAKARQLSADPPLCRAQLALAEMVALRRQLVDSIKRFGTYRQQVAYEASAPAIECFQVKAESVKAAVNRIRRSPRPENSNLSRM